MTEWPVGRGRADDAVEQRHAEAEGRAARERLHQAAGDRAVKKKFVADAHVVRRHHEGQAVGDEADVADERFIENASR